jgi:hypothetical protein
MDRAAGALAGRKAAMCTDPTQINRSTALAYLILFGDSSIPVKCESLGEAIRKSCTLCKDGSRGISIQGTEGFRMESRDIEIECARRIERDRLERGA